MIDQTSLGRCRSRVGWGIAAALLVAFVAQGVAAMMANSQTFDEGAHFASGYSFWATGDFRINAEDPPLVKGFCLLPVWLLFDLPLDTTSARWHHADQFRIGFDLLYRSAADAETLLNLARLPNLFLGASVVALVGWWSYRVWGPAAGLLTTALAALEPTLVAHSTNLTTDAGWTLFCAATLYAAWEFCRSGSWKWLVCLGIATGLALSSKFSAVSLIGILPVVMGCYVLTGGQLNWLSRTKSRATGGQKADEAESPLNDAMSKRSVTAASSALQILLALLALAYIALVVVWAVYLFQDPILWWNGLQLVLEHQEHGHRAWFWGEHSNTGWPEYFFVALGTKTQVATLVLSVGSLVFFWKGKPLWRDGVVFLLLPLCMFLSVLVLARINIGVRHALHVYPLLFILAGRVATVRTKPVWLGRAGIGLLLALSAFSAWRIAPYPVAYFNELVGGPAGGRQILSDSNLDWGQGLSALAEYIEQEGLDGVYLSYFGTAPPEYYGIQYQYVPSFGPLTRPEPTRFTTKGRELFAISDFNQKGVWLVSDERYAWLAERTPVATLAHSIYVYDITDDAAAHFNLAAVYIQANMPQYAAWELEKVLAIEPHHDKAKRLMDSLRPISVGSGTTD